MQPLRGPSPCYIVLDGPVARPTNLRNEALGESVLSMFLPMGFFCAGHPAVDLHIFSGYSFDVEATFVSFSNLRAIEFSNALSSRGGLGHVIDEEARHRMVDDFRC